MILQELALACQNVSGQVKSDQHLGVLKKFLKDKIAKNPKNTFTKQRVVGKDGKCTKNFDIVWVDEDGLHAIELKSMNGSAAKNINNRIEEMVGQSFASKVRYNLKTFKYIFVDNCEMKDLTKDKLFIQSEDLISRGFLDDISIFQTHDSKFYKTKSFENWIF